MIVQLQTKATVLAVTPDRLQIKATTVEKIEQVNNENSNILSKNYFGSLLQELHNYLRRYKLNVRSWEFPQEDEGMNRTENLKTIQEDTRDWMLLWIRILGRIQEDSGRGLWNLGAFFPRSYCNVIIQIKEASKNIPWNEDENISKKIQGVSYWKVDVY